MVWNDQISAKWLAYLDALTDENLDVLAHQAAVEQYELPEFIEQEQIEDDARGGLFRRLDASRTNPNRPDTVYVRA